MKFTTALLTSLPLIAAAPLQPTYDVSIDSFSFSGVPHSVVSYYSFNITSVSPAFDSDTATYPVTCSTTTNTGPDLAFFGVTACQDPDWSFDWHDNGEGTTVLGVSRQHGADGTHYYASRTFEAGSVKSREAAGGPNGVVQYLETNDGGDFVLLAQEVRSPA